MKVAARSVITALGISLVVCLPHGAVGAGASSSLPALDNTHAHPPVHGRGNATISPSGYAPDQIRRAYGFDRVRSDGSGQFFGIVDAHDDPTIANDLQTFVTTLGLRPVNRLPGTRTCTVAEAPLDAQIMAGTYRVDSCPGHLPWRRTSMAHRSRWQAALTRTPHHTWTVANTDFPP
jgi:hypothetical protein